MPDRADALVLEPRSPLEAMPGMREAIGSPALSTISVLPHPLFP